jgi:hypothetical protein
MGVYFYPWYCARRWRETPHRETPSIGEYDSRDPAVIEWQAELIASCGFDYVAFETLPNGDWGCEHALEAIGAIIPRLRQRGLSWTFLLDVAVSSRRDRGFEEVEELLEHIESRGWTDDLVPGPTGLPLMLVFFPWPDHAERIHERYAGRYEFRFPTGLPHWGPVDYRTDLPIFAPILEEAKRSGKTPRETLTPLGYVSFWDHEEPQVDFDGFCSALPGYDDSLLKRDPPLAIPAAHRDGETLRQRFHGALRLRPRHVIFYGWNEYFERSQIEPTREHGNFYTDLTRELIAEVRAQ